jgi:hypothetical protein
MTAVLSQLFDVMVEKLIGFATTWRRMVEAAAGCSALAASQFHGR